MSLEGTPAGCIHDDKMATWMAPGLDICQVSATDSSEIATTFSEEARVRVWFSRRLSNFLPGHSELNMPFQHGQSGNTRGCDRAVA